MATMNLTAAGVRKAAVVLIQLGKDGAASVLSHLSDAEVEAISAEIARLEYVDANESTAALTEFRNMASAKANIARGGLGFARTMLEQSLGADKASEIMERLQAAAVDLRPELGAVLEHGVRAGAIASILSGSGPTCAFLCETEARAMDVASALASHPSVRAVKRARGPVPGARPVA